MTNETPSVAEKHFELRSVHVENVGGRDGVYFDAVLDGVARRFLITHDALQTLDDRVFVGRDDVRAAFDRNIDRIQTKVVDILTVGGSFANPVTLGSAEFES
jgi:hypothetical protein